MHASRRAARPDARLVSLAVPLAAVLTGTACSRATAPQPEAVVSVAPDTLAATLTQWESVTWLRFTVPVAVHNAGATPLRLGDCSVAIEHEAAGGWELAWSPACPASAGEPPSDIAPGETRQFQVEVSAATAGPASPKWEAPGVAGVYRATVAVYRPGARGRIPMVASNAFALHARD